MNNLPYFYNYINAQNSVVTPSTLKIADSATARFFKRGLLQKAISRFKFDNLPESWDIDYFNYVLFELGYIAILNTDRFGIIPQNCGLSGFNVYYHPTTAIITNPVFDRTYELLIGRDCEIIKLSPDYAGIMDIIEYYGNLMALAVSTAEINIHNSKLSYIFAAKDKSSAESWKKMYDKISGGETAVVIDKNLLDDNGNLNIQYFTQNVGQNYVANDILITLRTLENMFDTEIGIPNANVDKRERLTDDEVNVNNAETYSRANLWLDTLRDGIYRVNKMFNLDISVNFRKYQNPDIGDIDPVEVEVDYES